jgi:hypothetical protein
MYFELDTTSKPSFTPSEMLEYALGLANAYDTVRFERCATLFPTIKSGALLHFHYHLHTMVSFCARDIVIQFPGCHGMVAAAVVPPIAIATSAILTAYHKYLYLLLRIHVQVYNDRRNK